MPFISSSVFDNSKFSYYDLNKKTVGFIEDFILNTSYQSSTFLTTVHNGTGAGLNPTTLEANKFGIIDMDTGTTSTGHTAVGTEEDSQFTSQAYNSFLLGNGITMLESLVKIPTLSTSGERFKVIFGFIEDPDSSTVNDGIWIEYNEASSANWRYCASNDGTTTGTLNSSSISVDAGSWYRLTIIVNTNATSVDYFVNNINIGTYSSNIPTGTGDGLDVALGIYKSVGTTSRNLLCDYIALNIDLSTQR